MAVDLYEGLAGTVSAPVPGPAVTGAPVVKATAGNRHFHGTKGDPGYPALHSPGKGKKKTPGGGMLGSRRFSEAQHRDAANEYLFEAYSMNAWLRRREVPDGTVHDAEDLDDYTARMMDLIEIQPPSTEDEVVYRGMEDPFSFAKQLKRGAFQMRPGDEFHDKGFISTSENPEVAARFAKEGGFMMRITIPKGTRSLDMNKTINDKPAWEKEHVLQSGTRFKFLGYAKRTNDELRQGVPPTLLVEVIPA